MPDIKINGKDGSFMAYQSGKSGPGIVLIQEIFGVNKVMRDLADGFARQGYVVVCPDLFWRQKPGIQITDQSEAEWAQAFDLYKGFNEAKGVEDLAATLVSLPKRAYIFNKRQSLECSAITALQSGTCQHVPTRRGRLE